MPTPPSQITGGSCAQRCGQSHKLENGVSPRGTAPHPALSSLCPRIPPSSIMAGGTPDGAWGRQPTSSSFKMGQTPEVSRPYRYCFNTNDSPGGTSGPEPLQHHGQILWSPRLSGPTSHWGRGLFLFLSLDGQVSWTLQSKRSLLFGINSSEHLASIHEFINSFEPGSR